MGLLGASIHIGDFLECHKIYGSHLWLWTICARVPSGFQYEQNRYYMRVFSDLNAHIAPFWVKIENNNNKYSCKKQLRGQASQQASDQLQQSVIEAILR